MGGGVGLAPGHRPFCPCSTYAPPYAHVLARIHGHFTEFGFCGLEEAERKGDAAFSNQNRGCGFSESKQGLRLFESKQGLRLLESKQGLRLLESKQGLRLSREKQAEFYHSLSKGVAHFENSNYKKGGVL
jgi:hypothetical protein